MQASSDFGKLRHVAVINSELKNVAAGEASSLGLFESAMVENSAEYLVGLVANGTFLSGKVDISCTRFASGPVCLCEDIFLAINMQESTCGLLDPTDCTLTNRGTGGDRDKMIGGRDRSMSNKACDGLCRL